MILCVVLSCQGCFLSTKKEVKIVRTSVTKHPEEARGFLWIATEEPIDVSIEGTDLHTKKVLGGYYVIHKDDLKALLERCVDESPGK